jgi:hypothetical protein
MESVQVPKTYIPHLQRWGWGRYQGLTVSDTTKRNHRRSRVDGQRGGTVPLDLR